MLMVLLNSKLKYLLGLVLMALTPGPQDENIIVAIDQDIEEWNMLRLAEVQMDPDSPIVAFTTDGCSGGLSFTWERFSRAIPAFAQKYGDRPPWEYCCVEHDRAYWQGETNHGFEERLKADQTLRQCVLQYGIDNQQRLAEKLDVPPEKLASQFELVARLMYQAVRVGGKPCSYLPWRWGYGWPHCKILPSDAETRQGGM